MRLEGRASARCLPPAACRLLPALRAPLSRRSLARFPSKPLLIRTQAVIEHRDLVDVDERALFDRIFELGAQLATYLRQLRASARCNLFLDREVAGLLNARHLLHDRLVALELLLGVLGRNRHQLPIRESTPMREHPRINLFDQSIRQHLRVRARPLVAARTRPRARPLTALAAPKVAALARQLEQEVERLPLAALLGLLELQPLSQLSEQLGSPRRNTVPNPTSDGVRTHAENGC